MIRMLIISLVLQGVLAIKPESDLDHAFRIGNEPDRLEEVVLDGEAKAFGDRSDASQQWFPRRGRNADTASSVASENGTMSTADGISAATFTTNGKIVGSQLPPGKKPEEKSFVWIPWVTAALIFVGIGLLVGLLFICIRKRKKRAKMAKTAGLSSRVSPSAYKSLATSNVSNLDDSDDPSGQNALPSLTRGLWAMQTITMEATPKSATSTTVTTINEASEPVSVKKADTKKSVVDHQISNEAHAKTCKIAEAPPQSVSVGSEPSSHPPASKS